MFRVSLLVVVLTLCSCSGGTPLTQNDSALALPSVGFFELQILTPNLLELTLVTTKKPEPARVEQWNFTTSDGRLRLPATKEFIVLVGGKTNSIAEIGFKRRVLYAPLKERDLRIGNYLYLRLETPIAESETVEVLNPSHRLWTASVQFTNQLTPRRYSPILHINQVGYMADKPKEAMIGYYLGSLGELDLNSSLAKSPEFKIVQSDSSKEVFSGQLKPRTDRGFPFSAYQKVLEADFSSFKQPGEYRLAVPRLGESFPFHISDDVAGVFARTYALGIYHQRCGTANELPFTRFTHGPCHTAPAEVPTMSSRYESVNDVLTKETEDAKENPRHTAPPLKNIKASLYPFVNKGLVDVSGGHHDAGDYSKYTENSATFIHLLVFATDNFPGVGELDNLGIPESGDGKSDILQEAKWEADFLAKMQDADGGFYFLVYPRERRYENDVTPDHGDPQIVFPKTTSVSAAATAALAQCASSPTFKKQFPEAAALYLEKAKKGWAFLERAVAKYGKDGAYQKITHYGNDFMHNDELAWGACELYLATGDPKYQSKLLEWFDPSSGDTRKWGWWRLFEAYGHATRDYAFAARSGRLKRDQLDPKLLEACENELIAAVEEQLQRANDCAYGTSFPSETKRTRSAGWYFTSDAGFDLAVASQLDFPPMNDPHPKYLAALLSNLNFEAGCNPVNVCYLTGIGWKRQREIVHQYAQNDRRMLPPSGIPLGCIQDGFGWMDNYGEELGVPTFPKDDDDLAPYPFYDRWGDSFNLKQEFVISNQARGLGCTAWLMAQTALKTQKWKAANAEITGLLASPEKGKPVKAGLTAQGVDLSQAQIVWETAGNEPALGKQFNFTPTVPGRNWIEAEALLPDGRRVFGTTNFDNP